MEGSFLHTGIAAYVRQWKRGILLRKGQGKTEFKEDFSTTLEMTVRGIAQSRKRGMRAGCFICFPASLRKANLPIDLANKDSPY